MTTIFNATIDQAANASYAGQVAWMMANTVPQQDGENVVDWAMRTAGILAKEENKPWIQGDVTAIGAAAHYNSQVAAHS